VLDLKTGFNAVLPARQCATRQRPALSDLSNLVNVAVAADGFVLDHAVGVGVQALPASR
jgi:hypothetical protein